MGGNILITVFAVVVIGGFGSILGAIVTGLALGVLEGFSKVFYPEASNMVIFAIMIVVLHGEAAGPVRYGSGRMALGISDISASADQGRAACEWVGDGDRRRHPDRRAVRRLSRVPDGTAVHGAVRLRLQSADRRRRAAVVRPCRVLRRRRLYRRRNREGIRLPLRAGDARRHRDRDVPRLARGPDRDPPQRADLRDDHAGAGAGGLFPGAAPALHAQRGRHPGGAARLALRRRRSARQHGDVLRHRRDLLPRLSAGAAGVEVALRPGAARDQGQSAAHDLARLPGRPLQADQFRPVGGARRASPAR